MIPLIEINACDTESFLRTFKALNILLTIAKIAVPIIIMIVGMKDLFKVITSGKEDELKSYVGILVRRIIAGLVVFFIPTIMNAILNLYTGYQDTVSSFAGCSVCLTNQSECDALISIAKKVDDDTEGSAHTLTAEEEELWEKRNSLASIKKPSNGSNENGNNGNSGSNGNSGTNTNTNRQNETVGNGKYFNSDDVTKISGLTEEEFKNVLQNSKAYKGKAKVYLPLAHDLILAEKNHGVNAFYLIGLYSYESGWLGSTLTKKCNNIGGVRYYKQSYGNGKTTYDCYSRYAGFDSISEFIDFHANLLEKKYLTPGASHYHGTSVASIAKDYGSGHGIDTIIQIATRVSSQ